jgi:hypothetical protein
LFFCFVQLAIGDFYREITRCNADSNRPLAPPVPTGSSAKIPTKRHLKIFPERVSREIFTRRA